jgi:predicted glycogen debranching enzyme
VKSQKKVAASLTSIERDVLQDYDVSSRREWLVTNGQGGYASGSVAGANTRRYHGLLVASVKPPTHRVVTLSRVEEEVRLFGNSYALATNQYPGVTYPEGFKLLEGFDSSPVPTFDYRVRPDTLLRKSIWMAYGQNTTYIRYELIEAPQSVELTLSSLVCWKDYHSEMASSPSFPASMHADGDTLEIEAYTGSPRLRLSAPGASATLSGYWHTQIEQLREFERGLEFREDLFCAGKFMCSLKPGESITVVATLEEETLSADEAWDQLLARQATLVELAIANDEVERVLAQAADAFVIPGSRINELNGTGTPPSSAGKAERSTIIAGYPWFTDWGRDTMISLPGLCIATGRKEIARDILVSYCHALDQGMIPNRFQDGGDEPEYNTVDATLWMFQALNAYCEAFDSELEIVRALWDHLAEIVDWHCKGTRYCIRVDESDGLLRAGEPGVQLTWMDARIGDWVVTPRQGKPVEINALWHSAMQLMADWAKRIGRDTETYASLAAKAKKGFSQFVRPDGLGLYDVLTDSGSDAAIRPNQVFAVSLPHCPLALSAQKAVLKVVEQRLLTPTGLRTLSPNDPGYRPRYEGGIVERDSGYHQGTVWPWLIGGFVEGHLRVYKNPKKARAFLKGLVERLNDGGVGSMAEVYDGDIPQRPNGCPFQAWSVGELLRTWRLTRTDDVN